jgi:hypothetical protein
LLGRWREHLADLPAADHHETTATMIDWPSRDVSGVNALLKHGMQAITVLAVRPAGRAIQATDTEPPAGVVIREARPDDLDAVMELEMDVIRFDAHFGAAIMRPSTEALVRDATRKTLARRPAWAWVAERDGRLAGLVHVQPPDESVWIAGMTARARRRTCRRCSWGRMSAAAAWARRWSSVRTTNSTPAVSR